MRVDTKEWYVFPEGSDANTRVLSLPGIDPDSDPIDTVCADGRRRGLWKIQDENLVLKTLKREKELNGLCIFIFLSLNGSPPQRWTLCEKKSKTRQILSVQKWLAECRRKKADLKPPLF
ncbi:MAG: hypothetical protein RJA61_474 [Candidatus Parcubacteria bacterium]|jgi:hypothetical protein